MSDLYAFHSYTSYKDKRYACNLCRFEYSAQDHSSLHCPKCKLDMCPPCAESSHLVCRKGHRLHKVSNLRFVGVPSNTYTCDACGKRGILASTAPTHRCQDCDYDLCDNCSKPIDLICKKGHRLHKTFDLSKTDPGYSTNIYYCNGCEARCLDATKVPSYHCAPCHFDLFPRLCFKPLNTERKNNSNR